MIVPFDIQISIISAVAAVAALGVAWYMGQAFMQITYVTLADGRRQERRLPFLFRMLIPFAPTFQGITSSVGLEKTRRKLSRQIVAAGYEGLLTPQEIIALRFLMPLVVGVGLCILLWAGIGRVPGSIGASLAKRQTILYLFVMVWAAFYPGAWLRGVLKKRHRSIERALPFVLDLMTLSVESGVDFMNAMRRIIERRQVDALSEELIRVFRQIQVGKTRREALQDLSERVNHVDIYAVTNALIQADELGTSIGAALRIQADQMRIRRYQRAEKMGNEAPIKLLFPLAFFIFPAVGLVLIGPVLLQLFQTVF